jgi:hypothetical protein
LKFVDVLLLQGGEVLRSFTVDELGLGIEAGFEGVHGRTGFAFRSTRSGGFESIEPVGLDLTLDRHRDDGAWVPRRHCNSEAIAEIRV